MDLQWLVDFQTLAVTGNFSRAAVQRNTTQSALSRRIQTLENWVGTQLVDRSTYPVRLTVAGRIFCEAAGDVTERMQAARVRARAASGHLGDPIAIAATHTIGAVFFPRWLANRPESPGPVRLDCYSADRCLNAVESGLSQFALFPAPSAPLETEQPVLLAPSIRLATDEMIPVCAGTASGAPRFPLPGAKRLACPYLSIAQGSLLGGAVRRMLAERDVPAHLDVVFETPEKEVIRGLALSGVGVAWLPFLQVADDLRSGQLVRAGGPEWSVPYDIRLMRAKGPLPANAELFWTSIDPLGSVTAAELRDVA